MAEGRLRESWRHTSLLCATLVNSNPYRKGEPVTPAMFDPYARPANAAAKGHRLEVGIDVLQMIFCPRPRPTK